MTSSMETFSAFPAFKFMRGIHRSPVNSPYKGQWSGALPFSLTCVWTNGWANNREAGELRRHRAHYDATVMNARNTHIGLCNGEYQFAIRENQSNQCNSKFLFTILTKSPSWSSLLPIVLRTRRGAMRNGPTSQCPLKIYGGGQINPANSMLS